MTTYQDRRDGVLLTVEDGIAIITFARPKTLNGLKPWDYARWAELLLEVAEREDVFATVVTGQGRFFSAGTDVSHQKAPPAGVAVGSSEMRRQYLMGLVLGNTDVGRALANHPKLLIAALNGPVVGITAAFLGHFDFIYAVEDAWLLTPFSSLSIVAEGGSSVTFVNRMGLAKANEALILGKKMSASELHSVGFINKLYPSDPSHSAFLPALLTDLRISFDGLDRASLLRIKNLIQAGLRGNRDPDAVNLRETYSQAESFATGRPAEAFGAIMRKERKHKL